jgi:hypothetical protein
MLFLVLRDFYLSYIEEGINLKVNFSITCREFGGLTL